MTLIAVYTPILICDGCTAEFRPDHETNAANLRGEAFGAGWRFPSKVNDKDVPVSARCSDVCPDCIGAWVPAHYRSAKS